MSTATHDLPRMQVAAQVTRAERSRTALIGGQAHLDATTALLNNLQALKSAYARICGEDKNYFDDVQLMHSWNAVELEHQALLRELAELRGPPTVSEVFRQLMAA